MSPRRAVLLAVLALAAAACAPATPATSPAGARGTAPQAPAAVDLTVYGAASLKGALEKARSAYEAAAPGVTLTISTDASSALATKIEEGAPADVFLSADTRSPQALVDKGLTDGRAVPFAGNELTVIVPGDNPAGIATPADLARAGVKIIAAGDAVPITTYAKQLVDNLATEPGYPPGFAAAYAANVVSREDNVKAVVAKIELGEGDAGIVYATDAAASTTVAVIDVPASANVRATYAGVVLRESPNLAAARAFMAWLAGPDGRAILAGFGFLPPAS